MEGAESRAATWTLDSSARGLTCGAVIVAHASLDAAFVCVASLREWLPRDRVVVVLNDPRSVSSEAVERIQETCVVISPPSPQGYGANLNLGVRALSDDIDCFVLSNDDLVFQPGSIPSLLKKLSDPNVGVVGPTVVWGDGRTSHPDNVLPRLFQAFNPYEAVLPRPLFRKLQKPSPRQVSKADTHIRSVPGPVQVVRRAAFDAVSGFDEDFFLYYEEVDFTVRAARAGWRLTWAEAAVVKHQGGSSIPSEQSRALARIGLATYLRKRAGRLRWTLLGVLFLVLVGFSCLYSMGASIIRPSTAAHRVALLRIWWRGRLFFLSRTGEAL